jgi:aryl-alcohol dehydrogenase-like predicted oxidoreductase
MISRICLGTVQFGQDYGVSNNTGKTPKKEVFQILDYCANKGIQWLDTAEDYGESQKIIGEYLRRNPNTFKIQTKIGNNTTYETLANNFHKTLEELHIDTLDSYLFHSYEKFKNQPHLVNDVVKLKTNKQIKSVGVSIYNNEEVLDPELLTFSDEVQMPFNILDNFKRRKKTFYLLRTNSIKIQIRSIFLQGALLISSNRLPSHLEKLKKTIQKIEKIAIEHNTTKQELAICYAFSNSFPHKILIGIESLEQLKNNLRIVESSFDKCNHLIEKLHNIEVDESSLLNPSLWKTGQ